MSNFEVLSSAPVNTNYSDYAPVPKQEHVRIGTENNTTDISGMEVTSMYQRETIERQQERVNQETVIPLRYREPTDVSEQRRQLSQINKKVNQGSRKCYTCFPKRLAKEHTIKIDEDNKVKFHFDMCNRPLIIATPFKHINTLADFETPQELHDFFQGIRIFCNFWNIKDYQLQINHGSWQHHEHLHVKIRGNEDAIHKLRKDHFTLLKLQKDRNADTQPP
tara:strand:+ start:511 stop:1173 length:663 start_codon:yes stop_codon:yes gene_type:complete